MPGIGRAYVTKCDNWPDRAVLSGIVQYETGDRLAVPRKPNHDPHSHRRHVRGTYRRDAA
jgi:hypothetical protein